MNRKIVFSYKKLKKILSQFEKKKIKLLFNNQNYLLMINLILKLFIKKKN